ncbi:V-type ATP synthase subunit E [Halovenus sp. WSH3]|uniref:A-type ATP synthase subunit E n=1 Tax=Halovenus carboxidivorans TaxID=2692199 RepID=A0A6B0T431_9EURY|nr:V-type ATP synthase subunit E [Halovenus carboxidivorans]MXR53048.1 V-type ATP synthase subunit E [Halovenus carboxidivorans]
MSLDTVVEDIREQARARADEIRDEADAEAEEIIAEAEADAEEIREEILDDAERTIEQEREQKLSSAKLEAKQARLEARRDVLQSVRDDIEQEVSELSGDQRAELTEALLDATAEEFDDDASVRIYGRAEDQELLEELLEEYDGFEYDGEFDCLGGVVAESDESRVRVKNTFDSVLDEVWENNLREISDRLFEQ